MRVKLLKRGFFFRKLNHAAQSHDFIYKSVVRFCFLEPLPNVLNIIRLECRDPHSHSSLNDLFYYAFFEHYQILICC